MQFYSGEERLYFTKLFLNDQELKNAFLTYILHDEDQYPFFASALANNFCIQFSHSKYLYEDPGFTSTALIDAMDSGECVSAIYEQQLEQQRLYSQMVFSTSWNTLVDRGTVEALPTYTFTLYDVDDILYLYTNQAWLNVNMLGIYNELPQSAGYLDVAFYTQDNCYYVYTSEWTKANLIEAEELPVSSYDFYTTGTMHYAYINGSYEQIEYKGEVEELPQSADNFDYYTVDDEPYLAITVSSRAHPEIGQPMVFMPVQAAVEKATSSDAYWYNLDQKPFYLQALKSIKYGSIKHFFHENRDHFLPSYDMFLINSDRKRRAFVNTMFKEFDRFTDVVNSLATYNDPDNIPDQFLIYFMEILGYTVNDYDGTLDETQVRSLIKNLMEVYRYKGATYAFEVFFGCMGIDCGVQELYFDRRLFYQTEENPYTRTTSNYAFAYYLTPKNPVTSSYYFFSGDTVRAINMTAPITSGEWTRLLSSVEEPTEDVVQTMLGYIPDTIFTDMESPFTYFKTNYLLFNFSSPYNRIKYGTSQYNLRTTEISRTEFEAYKELMDKIIPVFIKQYYQNYFETVVGEEDIIHYGTSRDNPLDLFFVDSNVYNDDIIKNKLQTEGKPYLYPEITNADLVVGDFRVYRQLLQGNTLKDLTDHYVYDVIGGSANYVIHWGESRYLQMTAEGATVFIKEGSTNVYDAPDHVVVGTLSTDTEDISDGTFEVPISRYFWQVNSTGASYYGIAEGTSVRIVPDLFSDDTFVVRAGLTKTDVDYFAHTLEEDTRPLPTFGDPPKRDRLLFEHDSYREDDHLGRIGDTQVEFEYNSYSNPLTKIESNVGSSLTVTLE